MPVSEEVGTVGDDEEGYQDEGDEKRQKRRDSQGSDMHDLGIERQGPAMEPDGTVIPERAGSRVVDSEKVEEVPVGKQPIKEDFGTAVAVEGKQNDGPTDFYHPASVEPQRVIWLPLDTLGIATKEEKDIRAMGIEVSTENARMNAKGHVDIDGRPPGMESE